MRTAFRAADIAWQCLIVEDRGDGRIILVPPTVSKVDLFVPVLTRLGDLLRAYNTTTEPRIRLRVALHAGKLLHRPCG